MRYIYSTARSSNDVTSTAAAVGSASRAARSARKLRSSGGSPPAPKAADAAAAQHGRRRRVDLEPELGDRPSTVRIELRLGDSLEPPEGLQVLLEREAAREKASELRAVADEPTEVLLPLEDVMARDPFRWSRN